MSRFAAIKQALAPRAVWGVARRELAPRAVLARLFAFFAAPTDGSGAAVFRISYGILAATVAWWTALNGTRWFSNDGVMLARGSALKNTLFRLAPNAAWMPTLHVALLAVGALLLIIGLFPRIGAVLVFVAHTSLQHRTPQILNSGDRLFAILAFLALTMPLAHRASVHSWWRSRRGEPTPPASMWGQRIIQIQIAYVYAASAFSKLHNARWLQGRALRDVLASPVFAEWPTWLGFWPLVYAMTWGTLVFELGFPSLVWFRKLRPWLLLAGVGFHMGIDVLMIIPMFSYVMIVSYGAFLDDDLAGRLLAFLRLAPKRSTESPPTLRSASEAPPPDTSAEMPSSEMPTSEMAATEAATSEMATTEMATTGMVVAETAVPEVEAQPTEPPPEAGAAEVTATKLSAGVEGAEPPSTDASPGNEEKRET